MIEGYLIGILEQLQTFSNVWKHFYYKNKMLKESFRFLKWFLDYHSFVFLKIILFLLSNILSKIL